MGFLGSGVPVDSAPSAGEIWQARHEKKHGKKKTLGILAARLGRAVYHMLREREAFDVKRFFGHGNRSYGFLFPVPLLEVCFMPGIDFALLRPP